MTSGALLVAVYLVHILILPPLFTLLGTVVTFFFGDKASS